MAAIKLSKNIRGKMNKRLLFIYISIFILAFLALTARLLKLQIGDFSFLSGKASMQQLGVRTIPATRGAIYDRNMTPLAESAQAWDVAVSPAYIKKDSVRGKVADNLSRFLNIDRDTIYKQINNNSDYKVIAKQIDQTQYNEISQYMKKNNIGFIALVPDSKRYYPLGDFASQLIGFTGSGGQGLEGLEQQYDSVLAGIPGKSVYAKTATGGDMPYLTGSDSGTVSGNNLVLTIDETVQQDLESNLKQALAQNKVSNRVTGIVMDVNSGEILAMATEPGYNLNDPFRVADTAAQNQLKALSGNALKAASTQALQTQWRNKAITEPYEPGSTFKIITAAAALQEGTVTESTMFNDPGYVVVAGTKIHNWMGTGQGLISFLQGFEYSNDTVFIETGEMLGALSFLKYYGAFGLTEKTGVDLPGEAKSIYHTQSSLGPVQLASEAFGQSDKITAIQLITAVAASANGGYLVQPHVVREETDTDGNIVKSFKTTVKRQVVSSDISQEIDSMLSDEVNVGTGKNAYVAGYRIGGKTGTSQKLDDLTDPNAVVSSMVGVAPTDNPKVAVLVVMDEPHAANNYGGVIAAPVIGNIMSEILPYLGVVPKYTAQELAGLTLKTPNFSGNAVSAALQALKANKLNYKLVGAGQTVTAQVPAANDPIPQSGTVTLYLGSAKVQDTVTVPSVIGQIPNAAGKTLTDAGLNLELEGTGLTDAGVTAYDQEPAAGTKAPPGTVVTVKFRNNNMNVR